MNKQTELQSIIEHACNIAYFEDADLVVGRIDGKWAIAHIEDDSRQALMSDPTFVVHSYGVDAGHIARGEITEDWEIPAE